MKSTCMSCKFFKIEDTMSGYCRIKVRETGGENNPQPMVGKGDTCASWADCGQQYYIRIGWVKSQQKRGEKKSAQ